MTDLEMMQNRAEWPHWPLLPIKRRREGQSWPELGVLYAADPLEFFDVTLYELEQALDDGKKGEPTTAEELVKLGWVVD